MFESARFWSKVRLWVLSSNVLHDCYTFSEHFAVVEFKNRNCADRIESQKLWRIEITFIEAHYHWCVLESCFVDSNMGSHRTCAFCVIEFHKNPFNGCNWVVSAVFA